MLLTDNELRLANVFQPKTMEELKEVEEKKTRFVHYTDAEAALNIIRTNEIWMRKTSLMNDYSEVHHGLDCLLGSYNGEIGKQLKEVMEELHPGSVDTLNERFNAWLPNFQSNSYITSISKHMDDEDELGRLSMWRAYGKRVGIAIVLNSHPFLATSVGWGISSGPAMYLDRKGFEEEFINLTTRIRANPDLFSEDPEILVGNLFLAFRYATLCSKHKGFAEEKEWRVIYNPNLDSERQLASTIREIDGVPQIVYRIPFEDSPDKGLYGLDIPKLFNRIIIGPTSYPYEIFEAFVRLLEEKGVQDAESKVFVSSIPLRV